MRGKEDDVPPVPTQRGVESRPAASSAFRAVWTVAFRSAGERWDAIGGIVSVEAWRVKRWSW